MHVGYIKDTICAVSTPPGMGAIAVIRISGEESISKVNQLFSKDLSAAKGYSVHYGTLNFQDKLIDEVVVTLFRNPNSFTGEDSVEIACHGSVYIQKTIIQTLIAIGVRLAEPGEFSKRAFYNGKKDLTQTEAIADLIHSESAASHELALKQMKGGITQKLNKLVDNLIKFASLVELELDFSEEDVEFADRTELKSLVEEVLGEIRKLKSSFKAGTAIKDGLQVALLGKPNAGKSSWINALVEDDVAIVSDIAGTTRDKIEVPVYLGGYKFRITDTAGLRETSDIIEKIGVEKALDAMKNAHFLILMIEINELSDEHITELMLQKNKINPDVQYLILGNKLDASVLPEDHLLKEYGLVENIHFVSVKKDADVQMIKDKLLSIAEENTSHQGDVLISNARHFEALSKAEEDLIKSKGALEQGITGDFVAMDIRAAIGHLQSISGGLAHDDILGHIFKNFCIGK